MNNNTIYKIVTGVASALLATLAPRLAFIIVEALFVAVPILLVFPRLPKIAPKVGWTTAQTVISMVSVLGQSLTVLGFAIFAPRPVMIGFALITSLFTKYAGQLTFALGKFPKRTAEEVQSIMAK